MYTQWNISPKIDFFEKLAQFWFSIFLFYFELIFQILQIEYFSLSHTHTEINFCIFLRYWQAYKPGPHSNVVTAHESWEGPAFLNRLDECSLTRHSPPAHLMLHSWMASVIWEFDTSWLINFIFTTRNSMSLCLISPQRKTVACLLVPCQWQKLFYITQADLGPSW